MVKSKWYPMGTFMKEFSNEAKCRMYMADLWWPGGFVCPKCGCVMLACCLTAGINVRVAAVRPQ